MWALQIRKWRFDTETDFALPISAWIELQEPAPKHPDPAHDHAVIDLEKGGGILGGALLR
jgi:hypothetical protein